MKTLDPIINLVDFKSYARYFIAQKVAPSEVNWGESEPMMFDEHLSKSNLGVVPELNVPKEFGKIANSLSMLRTTDKWGLLYKILYRLKFENKNLLQIPSDKDIRQANLYLKSIGRDIHKMHAFVRFKRAPSDKEAYVAWHKPEHLILRAGAPFFVKRFGDKPWSILTPDESAHWDGKKISFSKGVPFEDFNITDDWDNVWKDYYRSIYNPTRLNVKMMKQEMAPKYWKALPEAEIIQELIKNTPDMLEKAKDAQWLEAQVDKGANLSELQSQLQKCSACPLYECATQVVPGEGRVDAKIVIVGEQPGELEDKIGKPFQGPSGEILNQCLAELGIKRSEIYFTNSVKHFRFTESSGKRNPKKPTGRQIHACKPWLEAELAQIKPQVIICLGVTAATALTGKRPTLSLERGDSLKTKYSDNTIISWHPSSILRSSGEASKRQLKQLKSDIALAYSLTF